MLKAALTLFILGTSSIALADPGVDDPLPSTPEPYARGYRDDAFRYDRGRFPDPSYGPLPNRYDHGWHHRPVLLAQGVRLSGFRERPTWIPLDPQRGTINRLRFELAHGNSYIDGVVVFYANGHRERISVRQPLTYYQRTTTIDLPHADVTGLYIYGTQMRGRFGKAGGAVDVIGLRR